jgi:hypothetical protein
MPAIPARERENWGLKPALANSSGDPILKKPITKKKRLVGWFKVKSLSTNPSTRKKKKRRRRKSLTMISPIGHAIFEYLKPEKLSKVNLL